MPKKPFEELLLDCQDNLPATSQPDHHPLQVRSVAEIEGGKEYIRVDRQGRTKIKVVNGPYKKDGSWKIDYRDLSEGENGKIRNGFLSDLGIVPNGPSGFWNATNHLLKIEEKGENNGDT